jgi:hypothetical protein
MGIAENGGAKCPPIRLIEISQKNWTSKSGIFGNFLKNIFSGNRGHQGPQDLNTPKTL